MLVRGKAEPPFMLTRFPGARQMTDAEAVQRRKWLALALLATTQFVIILDAAIVNVAIPSIGRDLNFSPENLTWIPNAYALTFGGFLLLAARRAATPVRRRPCQR